MKLKIDDLKQKPFEKMVEIFRMPASANENCINIVQEVNIILNVTIQVEKDFRTPINIINVQKYLFSCLIKAWNGILS